MSTTLSENIRRLRKAAGLSVSEAARNADIHRVAWTEIEQGKNANPTTSTLSKIAGALDRQVSELFVDEDGESVMVGVVAPCPKCGREIEGKRSSRVTVGFLPRGGGGSLPKPPPAGWGFTCPDCKYEWLRKD